MKNPFADAWGLATLALFLIGCAIAALDLAGVIHLTS